MDGGGGVLKNAVSFLPIKCINKADPIRTPFNSFI